MKWSQIRWNKAQTFTRRQSPITMEVTTLNSYLARTDAGTCNYRILQRCRLGLVACTPNNHRHPQPAAREKDHDRMVRSPRKVIHAPLESISRVRETNHVSSFYAPHLHPPALSSHHHILTSLHHHFHDVANPPPSPTNEIPTSPRNANRLGSCRRRRNPDPARAVCPVYHPRTSPRLRSGAVPCSRTGERTGAWRSTALRQHESLCAPWRHRPNFSTGDTRGRRERPELELVVQVPVICEDLAGTGKLLARL